MLVPGPGKSEMLQASLTERPQELESSLLNKIDLSGLKTWSEYKEEVVKQLLKGYVDLFFKTNLD